MGCGIAMVKYLLFIFNFIFALIGIAILAIGVWIYLGLNGLDEITSLVQGPAITFIVVGGIIFVIAFFGCCGAIRESHCMVVTFAVFLLTILVVQIAIGIWAFILSKDATNTDTIAEIQKIYRNDIFINYWTNPEDRDVVDSVQTALSCCGVEGSVDFAATSTNFNGTIPWSCCGNPEPTVCTENIFQKGCVAAVTNTLEKYAIIIGGIAIGVAVTELIGIIFALCLANSIRNDDRRGYRV